MIADAPAGDSLPPAHFRRGAKPVRHQARRAATVLHLARGLSGEALDYGAGWGDLTARLAPQFSRIVGVDADAARVAFARAEYAPLEFSTCAPDHVAFADGSFDVVFSIAVLHFVPSAEDHLAECRRLLRPGGSLVILIQNPESMWMLGRRLLGSEPYGADWGGISRREIRHFLERGGFAIDDEDGFYDPMFDRVRTAGDVVVSLMNGIGHLLRLSGRWSYVGFRCRRTS